MRKVVVFDDGLGPLSPLTDLRACFDIRTGVLTTLDRLRSLGDLTALFVPPGIEALCRETHDAPVNDERSLNGLTEPILIVNGRCPLLDGLQALQPGKAIIEAATGHLVAALVPAPQALALVRGDLRATVPQPSPDHLLLSRPWHIRTFRDRAINADLNRLTSHAHLTQTILTPVPGVTLIGAAPVLGGPTVKVYPGAIIDTELGPIFLGDHAVVRPGTIISGPAAVGAHSTVLERATIKPFTSIGPWCKVNGEVGGTIFQGYANKAHDGHLGDSYIGEWSNLGAGATNSNLLNTYSEIVARATPTGPNERTGETFLGAIIGDHARFAICTRIMTGAVVNTGVMYAATAPASGCIPAFSWVTDSGARRFRLDKFTDTALAVMARRKVEPSAAYLQQIAGLHAAANE